MIIAGGRDDVYSAVYDNHAYDNVDSPTSERGGRAGSGIMYVYSGRKGQCPSDIYLISRSRSALCMYIMCML